MAQPLGTEVDPYKCHTVLGACVDGRTGVLYARKFDQTSQN